MGSYANPEILAIIDGSSRLGDENSILVYDAFEKGPLNESVTPGDVTDGSLSQSLIYEQK